MSPLNCIWAACLLGLLLAVYYPLPVWMLAIALALLLLPVAALRYLACFIAAAVWAGYTNSPVVLPAQTLCQATLYVADFPVRRYPFGFRLDLQVADSGSCPISRGTHLLGSDFSKQPLALATVINANIKLKPVYDSPYIRRRHFRAAAHIIESIPMSNPRVVSWAVRMRAATAARIAAVFPDDLQGWLQGLLIGNRTQQSVYLREQLQRSGTSHLMAISGLHVALIALPVFWLLQWLAAYLIPARFSVQPRTLALHGCVWIALLYVLLTGAAAPVLRAWLMLILLVAAWHFPWLRGAKQLLPAAGIGLFLWQPWQWSSPGTWLSFAAVALIIYSAPRWQNTSRLRQLLYLQCWLSVGLLPLSWALFGGFSLIAPVANILLIPWLTPVLLSALLTLVFPVLLPLTRWLTTHYFGALQQLAQPAWVYYSPNWQPALPAACLMLFVVLAGAERRYKKAGYFLTAALLYSFCLIILPGGHEFLPGKVPVAILRTDKHTIIVNTGVRSRSAGRDDAARKILPKLRRRGESPSAILLTGRGMAYTSALKTLLQQYPDTPVFSLVANHGLPFAVDYCPKKNPAGIVFMHTVNGCQAMIANQVFHAKH